MPQPIFADLLRTWRKRCRYSQLDLGLAAGLSQRHISFLETGRARPSRYAVRQIGEALAIPAAEVEAMMLAAGFATTGTGAARGWDDATRQAIDASITHVLQGHEPYPAVAMDWRWTVSQANGAAQRFFLAFGDPQERNMVRAVLKPGRLRDSIVNWSENAHALLRMIELEAARRPSDPAAMDLFRELSDLAGLEPSRADRQPDHPAPVLTLHLRIDGADVRLFSMIATIGMSHTAAVDDIRIETLLPADAATRQWFATTAAAKPPIQ